MPIDDIQPDEAGSKPVVPTEDVPKARSALSRLKRELSDEELGQPGVQKLLLDYLFRAEEENATLRSIREKYHEADKENGILREKLKTGNAMDLISIGTLTIGGVVLGSATSVWASQPTGWIALLVGVALIVLGIVAKAVRT